MKKKNILAALMLSLTLGLGATAYASVDAAEPAVPSTNTNTTTSNGIGLKRATGFRGYDFVTSIIKEKLNVTEEDINNARAEGKTMSEFAEEKGLSHDDFKAALIESKNKAIDEAVTKGTISKEDGEAYKKAIKEKAANAVPGQGRLGTPRGNSQGRKSQGLRDGSGMNCPADTQSN